MLAAAQYCCVFLIFFYIYIRQVIAQRLPVRTYKSNKHYSARSSDVAERQCDATCHCRAARACVSPY